MLLLLMFLIMFFVYQITSPGNTPYNYFTRLAGAFVNGKYWLTEQPSWLTELVPVDIDKYFVVQPPMPAILLTPILFLFGPSFEQQYLAHILGAGTVSLTAVLSFRIIKQKKIALWSSVLIGLGSIFWFLSSVGSVWYLSQVTAAFFLTAALVESLGKKRTLLVGIYLGAAYLSRIHTILSLPLYLYLLRDQIYPNIIFSKLNLQKRQFNIKKQHVKNIFYLLLGLLPFFLFNFSYNFIRFGVIWDKGYFLIPGIYDEPWFSKGMLHPAYILSHLKLLFIKLPIFLPHKPFIQPSWYGLAIWITTPAFIYSLKAPIKDSLVKVMWVTILLMFLLLSLRGGTGWIQFGYRYAVDFYPFLIFLTIKGVSRTGLKWHHWALLIIGVTVNLWGVLWINHFGWVSY